MLFDTHTHYSEEDGPFPAWYQRAADAGVSRLLLCSSGWENSRLSQSCAQMFPDVWFAAGVHPQDARTEQTHDAGDYVSFTADPKCIAVGEIGLDYYYDSAPEDVQRAVFQSFLDLALQTGKPAVIHCRDKADNGPAYDHAYEQLKPFAEKGGRYLLHAFAGSPEWLKKHVALGACFGVGGMVTFKKADNIRVLASAMPLDRILLETDSPYLAPVPFRGKPNHPAWMPYTAAFLAALRGMTPEQMGLTALENANRFFRLEA